VAVKAAVPSVPPPPILRVEVSVPAKVRVLETVRVLEMVPPATVKPVPAAVRVRPLTEVGVMAPKPMVNRGAVVVAVQVAVTPLLAAVVSTEVTVPVAAGVCQVAAVPEVAVKTCPSVGAVAAATLTTVVAELRASVLALLPVVSWFKVGKEVSDAAEPLVARRVEVAPGKVYV
jgi:hypothetical protein